MNSTSAIHRTGVASSLLRFWGFFPPPPSLSPGFSPQNPPGAQHAPSPALDKKKWELIVIDGEMIQDWSREGRCCPSAASLGREGGFFGMGMLEAISQPLLLQGDPGISAPGLPPPHWDGCKPPKMVPDPQNAVTSPRWPQDPKNGPQISKCCEASGWFHTPQNAAIPLVNSKLSTQLQPP